MDPTTLKKSDDHSSPNDCASSEENSDIDDTYNDERYNDVAYKNKITVRNGRAQKRIDEFIISLIRFVKTKPCLYETDTVRAYKHFKRRNNAWEQCGKYLNTSGERCKREWMQLRRTLNRITTENSKNAGNNFSHVTWRYFNEMQWVIPYVRISAERFRRFKPQEICDSFECTQQRTNHSNVNISSMSNTDNLETIEIDDDDDDDTIENKDVNAFETNNLENVENNIIEDIQTVNQSGSKNESQNTTENIVIEDVMSEKEAQIAAEMLSALNKTEENEFKVIEVAKVSEFSAENEDGISEVIADEPDVTPRIIAVNSYITENVEPGVIQSHIETTGNNDNTNMVQINENTVHDGYQLVQIDEDDINEENSLVIDENTNTYSESSSDNDVINTDKIVFDSAQEAQIRADEMLIKIARKHPILYSTHGKSKGVLLARKAVWKKIAKQLGRNVNYCMSRWVKLRTSLNTIISVRTNENQTVEPLTGREEWFVTQMGWLIPILIPRKKTKTKKKPTSPNSMSAENEELQELENIVSKITDTIDTHTTDINDSMDEFIEPTPSEKDEIFKNYINKRLKRSIKSTDPEDDELAYYKSFFK